MKMLDDELAVMEDGALTEAEQVGEQSLVEDVSGDMDELLGEDAMESDMEHAYASFFSDNEEDYDGFSDDYVESQEDKQKISDAFFSGGYHIEVAPDADARE